MVVRPHALESQSQNGTPSLLATLRASTWPIHERLDRRLARLDRFSRLDAYARHLGLLWGIHATIERRWTPATFGAALPDIDARRKLHLVEADLAALGSTHVGLPTCDAMPVTDDTAAAFGALYVIEGSTLGGRHLLRSVESRLGADATRGASYLASYGDRVDDMWRRFGSAAEAYCVDADRRGRTERAARGTFEAIETWLCGEPE